MRHDVRAIAASAASRCPGPLDELVIDVLDFDARS